MAWVSVSYRGILQVLHHPFYAGAYVFGRTETRRELDPEDAHRLLIRRAKRSREQWPVLIRDHHPGYISFAKYLENQDRIRDNEVMGTRSDEGHKGAPREGRALLQGLVRCGHCGRRMMVGYGGNAPGAGCSTAVGVRASTLGGSASWWGASGSRPWWSRPSSR